MNTELKLRRPREQREDEKKKKLVSELDYYSGIKKNLIWIILIMSKNLQSQIGSGSSLVNTDLKSFKFEFYIFAKVKIFC